MRMVPRLKDVADVAGVSIKTVSNVVNGYRFVSPETRERVMAAVEELGYRPNLAARYLRHSQVGVIALEVPDLRIPYFTELAQHAAVAAADRGYMLLLDHTGGQQEGEQALARGLKPTLIDGAILNPLSLERQDLASPVPALPIVLVGERRYPGLYDHVLVDNVRAAREATRHLIGLGRRRIGAIGLGDAAERGETVQLRHRGFVEAMEEAGLPVDSSLLVTCTEFVRAEGREAVRALLERQQMPDALFCFNDTVALGAIRGLAEAGLEVPDDVALIGVDGIEDGRFSVPSLSTISLDKERIAGLAVDLLVDRISGERKGPPQELEVPFQLIVRESTSGRPQAQPPLSPPGSADGR